MRSSIRLGAAAVPREGAGGDQGEFLRDRDAGAARAGHQRSQGDACPADAAGWTLAPCAFLAGSLARERALAELRKAARGDYMNLADPWLGKIKRG
jgi:hypothetical protein